MPTINRTPGASPAATTATTEPARPTAAGRPAAAPAAGGPTNPPGTFTPHVAPPPPLVVTNPTTARPAPIINAQDVFPPPPGNNPPLDYKVSIPPALVARYPKIFFDGGDIDSHLELETKWKVDLNDVAGMKKKLDQMVADPALVEQVLGRGWKVTANTKYIGKPMQDRYDDDPGTLATTAAKGAFRDRGVEGDRYNNINYKPDGGIRGATVFDPVIRTEYDMAVNIEVRDDPSLLAPLIGSGEHFDVWRFGPKLDPSKIEVVSDISDIRAKYNFEHESGLAIEASLDDVDWKSEKFLDKTGKPMTVKFGQLEMEKEHLAFAGNPGGGAPAAGPAAPAAPAAPAMDDDPLAALRAMSGPISMGGPPRIHTPTDAKSPAVRQTPDYPTQVEFNKALAKFLYNGKTPEAADQKNYTGFKLAAEKYDDANLKKLLKLS
jgi:hypothetical protein